MTEITGVILDNKNDLIKKIIESEKNGKYPFLHGATLIKKEGNHYVACDNKTGDAFIQSFPKESMAYECLHNMIYDCGHCNESIPAEDVKFCVNIHYKSEDVESTSLTNLEEAQYLLGHYKEKLKDCTKEIEISMALCPHCGSLVE